MEERIQQIRKAEEASHQEAYTQHELFTPGSWLAKPVKTVMELLPHFADYTAFRALDLGCGVGRNCIALAQALRHISCQIDCVDILPLAIEKLTENARRLQVEHAICGIISSIDAYPIQEERYDLILAVSALEHVDSRETFVKKLHGIHRGLRPGGIACLILNTGVREWDNLSGQPLEPQFEVNLPTEEMLHLLSSIFSGWTFLKHTVVHQAYKIPRREGLSALETDVVTWVVRKTS